MCKVNLNRKKLLIVSDSDLNLARLSQTLESEYEIFTAVDGEEGIEFAKTKMPDVILSDLVMPKKDGYEMIVTLKSMSQTKNIPVLFVSGKKNEKSEARALKFGAADYIHKPYSDSILKLRIQNQIKMFDYIEMIRELGLTDQLTSMPNRRSFDDRLYSEWRRAARDMIWLSMLTIDIDHFKKYNDTYGHLQGDIALKTTAEIIKKTTRRPGDFAARWGGEEFVILLADTPSTGAVTIAEKIRENIEKSDIVLYDGQVTKLTISIGVNSQIPDSGDTIESFIRFSDDALYKAKREGRNRVCLYDGKLQTSK